MDRILQMRKQDALLQDEIAHVISPDWQTVFEPEFPQIIGALQIELTAGAFFAAKRNDIVIAEAKKFRDVTPHHHATERRGQRRDEQSVITPRDRARNCAGGVTAEAVGHEPFAIEQRISRDMCAPSHFIERTTTGWCV